jgi:hypothetical protein
LSSFGEFIKNQGRSLWNNSIGVIVSGVLGCVKFVFQSVFGSGKKADEAAAEQPTAATTAAEQPTAEQPTTEKA